MKQFICIALLLVFATLLGCGVGIYRISSVVVEYNGSEYESGSTIELGQLDATDDLFYADFSLTNNSNNYVRLTEITVTGPFDYEDEQGLPYDLIEGDSFNFGLAIDPIEVGSISGTVTVLADGSLDELTFSCIAEATN